jgi:hypothetical protein
MLRPASMRRRVVSVARNAALPELPLAKAQNLRMKGLPKRVGYTESEKNKIGSKCFALASVWIRVHPRPIKGLAK